MLSMSDSTVISNADLPDYLHSFGEQSRTSRNFRDTSRSAVVTIWKEWKNEAIKLAYDHADFRNISFLYYYFMNNLKIQTIIRVSKETLMVGDWYGRKNTGWGGDYSNACGYSIGECVKQSWIYRSRKVCKYGLDDILG